MTVRAKLAAMNVPLRTSWTRQEFFDWAAAQEGRFEFDGFQPVAMTGGTAGHSIITQNLLVALRNRLRGGSCRPLGPDAGVATVGEAVRYPDALVTCSPFDREAMIIPGVVAVFEVVSPSTSRTDRILKLREYAAVPSILRYVILEIDYRRPHRHGARTAGRDLEGDHPHFRRHPPHARDRPRGRYHDPGV